MVRRRAVDSARRLVQQGDERRAVGHVGFGEDVLDVGFDGGEADAQPEGDVRAESSACCEKAGWLASGSPWPCRGVTRTVNAQAS